MSLKILSNKLDKLNEREQKLRQTYNVRGSNKFQHRYIKDLKEDFKEDLILRYGNKPYGEGWGEEGNEEENEEELEEENQNANEEQHPEEIAEDEEDEDDFDPENLDVIPSKRAVNNFRPLSGKISTFGASNRPYSASTIRPVTASSTGGNVGIQLFSSPIRPISAVSNLKRNSHMNDNVTDLTLSVIKTPLGIYHKTQQKETQHKGYGIGLEQRVSPKADNSAMFWKNTKKYDVSKTAKKFDTKQLLFDVAHTNPKMITSSDLAFLQVTKMSNKFDSNKLKVPKDYRFQEIAIGKRNYSLGKLRIDPDKDMDAKSLLDPQTIFNQSLSYIQHLRVNSPSESKVNLTMLNSPEPTNKARKIQRPVTAQPFLSAANSPSNNNGKTTLEIVREYAQENYTRIYFSSLSDARKKAFFMKLYSLEQAQKDHPSLNKELKGIQWDSFKYIVPQDSLQNINLLIIDLNTFDHAKYGMEFQTSGSFKVKDKEGYRNILDVYKDFIVSVRTNLISIIIYYETATNKVVEVFNRVLAFEKQENEYDLTIWRNIYRYMLHKLVLANTHLYPDFKSYSEFSKVIKEIIEDKKDLISPISAAIEKTKNHPIVVERNGQVYNFDFYGYIMESSSHYAKTLMKINLEIEDKKAILNQRENLIHNPKKSRPYSALSPNQKPNSPVNRKQFVLQEPKGNVLNDSSSIIETTFHIPASHSQSTRPMSSHMKQMANSLGLSGELHNIIEENPEVEKNVSSTRKGTNRKQSVPTSPKEHTGTKKKLDIILQGGKMDIYYPPVTATTMNSTKPDKFPAGLKSGPLTTKSYMSEQATFNSSEMLSPKELDNPYQFDNNGITYKYKSPLKRKGSLPIKARPQTAGKKAIQPHNSELSPKMKDIVASQMITQNGSPTNAPYRFKM